MVNTLSVAVEFCHIRTQGINKILSGPDVTGVLLCWHNSGFLHVCLRSGRVCGVPHHEPGETTVQAPLHAQVQVLAIESFHSLTNDVQSDVKSMPNKNQSDCQGFFLDIYFFICLCLA